MGCDDYSFSSLVYSDFVFEEFTADELKQMYEDLPDEYVNLDENGERTEKDIWTIAEILEYMDYSERFLVKENGRLTKIVFYKGKRVTETYFSVMGPYSIYDTYWDHQPLGNGMTLVSFVS